MLEGDLGCLLLVVTGLFDQLAEERVVLYLWAALTILTKEGWKLIQPQTWFSEYVGLVCIYTSYEIIRNQIWVKHASNTNMADVNMIYRGLVTLHTHTYSPLQIVVLISSGLLPFIVIDPRRIISHINPRRHKVDTIATLSHALGVFLTSSMYNFQIHPKPVGYKWER